MPTSSIELLDVLLTGVGDAAPGATTERVLGFQDGALKRFPMAKAGEQRRTWVTTSRNLTLADRFGGILTSTPAGAVIITIPLFANFSDGPWTRDPSNPRELVYLFQRGGLGQFILTPASGVTLHTNGLDLYTLAQHEGEIKLSTCGNGDNEWYLS